LIADWEMKPGELNVLLVVHLDDDVAKIIPSLNGGDLEPLVCSSAQVLETFM
jgi:hypothetical protein